MERHLTGQEEKKPDTMESIKKGNIAVQAENIFPIIKKFLYSEHEIFLRELIANAVDATTKLQALAMRGDYDEELGDLTIDIIIDKDKGTLTIRDRGIGMTAEEVDKYLNQVALSSAREFVEKYQSNVQLIGHFGLGFYSAFMVADKVEVYTRSYRKDAQPVLWICEGNPEYRILPTEKEDRGTDVVLHLNDESREYLNPQRVEEVARKYCGFMPIPIRIGKKSVTREVKENGKTKIVQEEVDNIINDTNPLWKQNPADITDEQYIAFYEKLYPGAEKPVFWIHLNIDHPFRLTGILYFPRIHQAMDIRRHKIQLYSNQVFVTDEVGQIVPEYLTLLHGVIDSPDIPLNVSRSYLQSDPNVRKISSYITRKVVGKLHDIFRQDRKQFEEKWDEMSLFIKYGMLSDEKFYKKAIEFALFKNIDERYFTLNEYKTHIEAKQKDKDDRYVLIYTTDPSQQHHPIQAVRALGYDVLWMGDLIDPHFIQMLEHRFDDLRFVRVDADIPEKLIDRGEKPQSTLSEKDLEKLQSLFESISDAPVPVQLEPLSEQTDPVIISMPEIYRRMHDMQTSLNAASQSERPAIYTIHVNTNHPLIAKLLRIRKDEKRQHFARYLLDLAMLSHNMLDGQQKTAFIQRALELMRD